MTHDGELICRGLCRLAMADDELMCRLRGGSNNGNNWCSSNRNSNWRQQPWRSNNNYNYYQNRAPGAAAAPPWPLLQISRLFSLATRVATAQTMWERCSSAMDLFHCLCFLGICVLRAMLLHLFSLSLRHYSPLHFGSPSSTWPPPPSSSSCSSSSSFVKPTMATTTAATTTSCYGIHSSNDHRNSGASAPIRFDPLHFFSIVDFRSEDLAVARALFQVLRLMSEMPVAAPKYEFLRALAEKMLQQGGCSTTEHVNNNNSGDCDRNDIVGKDGEYVRRRRRAAMEIALQAAFERAVVLLKDRLEQVQRERIKERGNMMSYGEEGEEAAWGRRRRGRSWWLSWWWRRCREAVMAPWKGVGLWGGGESEETGEEAAPWAMGELLGFLLEEAGEMMAQYWAAPPVAAEIGGAACWDGRRRRLRSLESAESAAEKAAQELLWLARRIHDCSQNRGALILDASLTWSSAGRRLPALSVRCPLPRVQSCLVRVCDLLFKELNHKSIEEHENSVNGGNTLMSLKAKLLVMWLPLFCNVRSAHDNPSFSPCEKSDILSNLEHMVGSLAFWEQEIVLSCWLQLYTRSPYDWPNLQHCFQTWLSHHRSIAPYE